MPIAISTALTVIIIFISTYICNAQNEFSSTAQANISATIVTPVSLSINEEMNFQNSLSASRGGGNIEIKLSGNTNNVTAADFTVMGNIGQLYDLFLPTNFLLRKEGSMESMNGYAISERDLTSGYLPNGSQHIKIGAEIKVAAYQAPGLYTSHQFEIMISYN